MLINLRNAMMSGKRLPYDAEVEYLESTGTQYINTGILPANNMSFDCAMMFTGLTSGDHAVLDSRSSGGTRFQMAHTYANKWTVAIGGSYDANGLAVSTNTFYQLHGEASNGQTLTLFANGSQVATLTATGGISTIPIYALARNLGANVDAYSKARIYSLKIYSNGVPIRDFIPVRVGTVGYLYDRVSGKLFGNAGTGDFVLGPDVVPVEWIESAGNQYIETGVKENEIDSYTLTTKMNILVNYLRVLGADGTRTLFGPFNSFTSAQVSLRSSFIQLEKGVDFSAKHEYTIARNLNNLIISVDGAVLRSQSITNYDSQNSISLISRTMASYCKLYYVHLSLGSTPVRSFRPVRVGSGSTWEGAMIDTLTRRVYRNAGTGAFAWGNDLKYPIPAE